MLNDFDITEIETTIAAEVRNLSVSANVWNNRPKAVSDKIADFVVVKVVGGLNDKNAYGECRVSVHLFARDVKEMKNSKRLSVMQKALAGLPLNPGRVVIGRYPRMIGDTADDFGFHARTINFKVFIKQV